ncbi:MAG: hypothetical protein K1060chlam1_01457 [Candidatus Anoxychlamydiales bacterium]|nr:hypothetical protein [Candidatus Anoxychlamydiales bacterium]
MAASNNTLSIISSFPLLEAFRRFQNGTLSPISKQLSIIDHFTESPKISISNFPSFFESHKISKEIRSFSSHRHTITNIYNNRSIFDVAIRRFFSHIDPAPVDDEEEASSSSRATSLDIPDDKKEEMQIWTMQRADFLDAHPDLEKAEDTCPITQENIYDRAVLTEDAHSYSFERSSLLAWLLTNSTNPLTRKPVDADTIMKLFAEAGKAAPSINGK